VELSAFALMSERRPEADPAASMSPKCQERTWMFFRLVLNQMTFL
jgi:hypothetical protein